jgi:hypothetical protein
MKSVYAMIVALERSQCWHWLTDMHHTPFTSRDWGWDMPLSMVYGAHQQACVMGREDGRGWRFKTDWLVAPTFLFGRLGGWWLEGQIDRAWCAVLGHKLVDSGYAGPDSGCIDIGCTRCGWSAGHVQLY